MARYRKKPVVIDAIQFLGTKKSCTEVTEFLVGVSWVWKDSMDQGGFIQTLEGNHEFKVGDWIIRGIAGEFYPCKPDIFQATYRLLDPEPASPQEIAEGAMNRLCSFDATTDNPEWTSTAKRICEFQASFAWISAERLANVARRTE